MARLLLGLALCAALVAAVSAWNDPVWRVINSAELVPATPAITLVNASRIHKLHIPPDDTLQIQVPVTIYLQDGTCWTYPAPHTVWRKNP